MCEKFFESLDRLGVLARMTRVRTHMREAELLQQRSDIALVIIDAETRGDDALEIDAPPSHDTIDPVRTRFDHVGEFGLFGWP